MTEPARTVELTPATIIIDGQPLPWPLALGFGTYYQAHPIDRKRMTLEFAVLVDNVTGLPGPPLLDGLPVPWHLTEPPYVTRVESSTYAVKLAVLVEPLPNEEPTE